MIKKVVILLLLSIVIINNVISSDYTITIEIAERIAVNFINSQKQIKKDTTTYKIFKTIELFTKNKNKIAYLCWLKPRGFVLISTDKRVTPILGYSYTSYMEDDNNNKNSSFNYWINTIAKQIEIINKNKLSPSLNILNLWETIFNNEYKPNNKEKNIPPLLTSTWNQDKFYNGFCPPDPNGPGGRAYAGCVATAMGQIMYYHRFPSNGKGEYSYYHNVYGTLSADFENTTYKWNKMTDKLIGPNDAVAELLYHCGVSVDMVYGPNGSGMYNHKAAYALKTHFRYSPQTRYVFRDSVSLDWDSLLLDNLNRKLPMYYAGWEADSLIGISGHAFVCDGYESGGYFHFNWGWGGSFDGYFYTDYLHPAIYDFSWGQEVIVDIYPDTTETYYPTYCSNNLNVFTHSEGSFSDGSEPLYNYLPNQRCFWLIAPEENIQKITINFKKFHTEDEKDFITIYDGADTSAQILGKFSGNINIPQINSTGNKVLIVFESNDSICYDGFFATWSVTYPVYCSGVINYYSPTDTIEDGSGIWNYNNNSNCKWNIQVENGKIVRLEFLEFDTEPLKDLVKVYDSGQSPSVLLGTFSGNSLPPVLYSSTNKMLITFITNQTITAQGWKAVYSSTSNINKNDYSNYFLVYPNPTEDFIYFYFPYDFNTLIIHFYDLTGKTIIEHNLFRQKNKEPVKINVSDLSKGFYFVSILVDDKEYITKKIFIK